MESRFFASLLIVGCVVLAGCSSDDVDGTTPSTPIGNHPDSTKPADRSGAMAAVAQPSTPSVQYLSSVEVAPAVVVAGHPLLYTRQILPVDAEGKLEGEGSAPTQIDQVLENLKRLLDDSGSGLSRLVKVNAYADSPETIDLFQKRLADGLGTGIRPAVSAVISPLPLPGAKIAVDAIAIADDKGEDVVLLQCEGVTRKTDCADVAVMPSGGVVYLSGQADKNPLAEATVNSMSTLIDVVHQLDLQPSQIVHVKVFVDSVSASDVVRTELKKLFPNQMLPPVSFVQWISSAPIEIEAVMHLPRSNWRSGETLSFYTPTDVQPSPVFSKVALVQTDSQIFISGLASREPGGGDDQVRDVFDQLTEILSASGSGMQHLAKATYYVSDKDASDMLNKLRPEYYDPERPPAASKAMVQGVGRADRTISMDMIAVGSGE